MDKIIKNTTNAFYLIQSLMRVVVDGFKFQLLSLIVRYSVSEAFQKIYQVPSPEFLVYEKIH